MRSISADTTKYRHNIMVDGKVVAVHDVQGSTSVAGGRKPGAVTITQSGSASYLHYDELGGVNAITNTAGHVTQRVGDVQGSTSAAGGRKPGAAFSAFGTRRDPATWEAGVSQDTLKTLKEYTDKGYTGEEELDNVALVDLNGRVYDPTVGRFISADPIMGGNRYAYVGNNPLRFTDPTGFCFLRCFWQPKRALNLVGDAVGDVFHGAGHALNEIGNHWQAAAAIALAAYTGGSSLTWLGGSSSFWAMVGSGAIAGGTFGGTAVVLEGGNVNQILRATIKGGAVSSVGGGLLYGANAVTADFGNNFGVGVVSHGVAGGLTSDAAGGSFKKGFELGGFAYTAYWGYQQMVNGEAPLWNPGHGTQIKKPPFCGCNEKEIYNNVGLANTSKSMANNPSFFHEGGALSKILNSVRGVNAIGTLHDVMMDNVNPSLFDVFNVPLMPVATALTTTALMNTTIGYGIVVSHEVNSGGP